jgi:signal peptidase I
MLLSLALAGCVNVSINVGQSPTPTALSSPAATAAAANCDAPGAGSILWLLQNSMEPTLEAGDMLLVVSGVPTLGDIVAFMPPAAWTMDPTPFVKRVIGLTDDAIEVRDGAVYRNGDELDEPYTAGPTTASPDQSRWTVAAGQLFVLGDNRQRSADSRVFGLIDVRDIIGIVTWRCGPTAAPLRSGGG